MAHDRDVAGLRCLQVLDDLSAYLDGELPPERRARIEAHVRGCTWCERFGGRFGAAVTALRESLGTPPPPPAEVRARLRARLRAAGPD